MCSRSNMPVPSYHSRWIWFFCRSKKKDDRFCPICSVLVAMDSNVFDPKKVICLMSDNVAVLMISFSHSCTHGLPVRWRIGGIRDCSGLMSVSNSCSNVDRFSSLVLSSLYCLSSSDLNTDLSGT